MKSQLFEDALTKKEVADIKERLQPGYEFDWTVRDESLEDKSKSPTRRKKLRVYAKSTHFFLAKDKKGRRYTVTYTEFAIATRKLQERVREMLKSLEKLPEPKSHTEALYISGMAVGRIVREYMPAAQYEKIMDAIRKSKKVRRTSEGRVKARRYYYNRIDVENLLKERKEKMEYAN